MSAASDGPGTGPVEEPVAQTGRPPVPGRAPADGDQDGRQQDGRQQDGAPAGDGVHRTERVPFPLPGLHQPMPAQAPQTQTQAPDTQAPDTQAPETGRLQLGGYPPRVPGAARRPDPAAGAGGTDVPAEGDDPRRPR
ncbi:hypothetical protein [Modestobacter sp. SYSU DS0290]